MASAARPSILTMFLPGRIWNLESVPCPFYSKAPRTSVWWVRDVLNLRKFLAHDRSDTLDRRCVFALNGETTMTDGELIAPHHLGRPTLGGVRDFAAERHALMNAEAHCTTASDRAHGRFEADPESEKVAHASLRL